MYTCSLLVPLGMSPNSWPRILLLLRLSAFGFVDAIIPVYFDSSNVQHRDLNYHPEMPERIEVCVNALAEEDVELIDIAEDTSTTFDVNHKSEPFSDEELAQAEEALKRVHDPGLVSKIRDLCRQAQKERISQGKDPLGFMGHVDGGDTFLTTATYDVCVRATAAWLKASRQDCAMALTRPPGHHATYGIPNGFCLFNFAAAAAAAQSDKVSIIDWDVHYGQGVAEIVKDRLLNVRYVSIHQTPAFPYQGETDGAIAENVWTVPCPIDTTWSTGYQNKWERALDIVWEDGVWEPELVIVCAGYDALSSDALAGVSLNAADYGRMTRMLRERIGPCRLLFGLEGGYQLKPAGASGNLPDAVVETVRALK